MLKMRGDADSLKFINLTRQTEIGANSYYLEIGGHRLVLDCGMHPKNAGEDARLSLEASGVGKNETILISHVHQDKNGTVGGRMRSQPRERMLMAAGTGAI